MQGSKPDSKAIYQDPLGRMLDPLPVYRRLVSESQGKINDLLTDWSSDDPVASVSAEDKLVRVARVAFALTPFAQTNGHTDAEVLDVLVHYLDYTAKKEKKPKSTQISPQSSARQQGSSPTSGCLDCI